MFANEIFGKYSYPDGDWYPCGSSDIVLRWNEHRKIISTSLGKQLLENKGSVGGKAGLGACSKQAVKGWWWKPKLDKDSQSMLYEEEVCRFVRQKLALANIRVDVRSYID